MKTGFMDKDLSDMTSADYALVFPIIKHRLLQLGLIETAALFDEAQRAIGWEIAKKLAKEVDGPELRERGKND